jgi:hypothetical protein
MDVRLRDRPLREPDPDAPEHNAVSNGKISRQYLCNSVWGAETRKGRRAVEAARNFQLLCKYSWLDAKQSVNAVRGGRYGPARAFNFANGRHFPPARFATLLGLEKIKGALLEPKKITQNQISIFYLIQGLKNNCFFLTDDIKKYNPEKFFETILLSFSLLLLLFYICFV